VFCFLHLKIDREHFLPPVTSYSVQETLSTCIKGWGLEIGKDRQGWFISQAVEQVRNLYCRRLSPPCC